eukprot:CAMPEP_0114371196 /NCGR_PEP_ID=MMETSP0101-20121206/33125_1 /TAXON_ID=38822 ORGANISM="Pteridomonas danica, Strain PT" /NCGR_SAMPLE_ID=MMETSP0101 /ASSEMBLY_ACC=CAM_ASM_000211 /LENGTH=71 /DNA_ID=CAMNT_0001523197 /DNA_START=1172 /DNA_END=1387 /DNA_ORIENTATION=+
MYLDLLYYLVGELKLRHQPKKTKINILHISLKNNLLRKIKIKKENRILKKKQKKKKKKKKKKKPLMKNKGI